MDDPRLVKRIIAGDERAVDVFFERYADLLFAFIIHRMDGERAEAQDVWQETLIAALGALPTWREESKLFTWLCAIARHKIADQYRRQGRAVSTAFSDVSKVRLSALLADGPLPEDVIVHRATQVRVVEALGALREDYRRVLVARYAQGCSVKQVARILGRTYKATESLLSRAREAFRKVLADLEEEKK
ncbi:MAG: RNA polymerase sigma factor [Anaerolineae bacterium]|nr:RNA polymerase sigma factor [Anaerolineae bacterium]